MLPRFATLCGQIVEPFSCPPYSDARSTKPSHRSHHQSQLCSRWFVWTIILWQLRIWQREIRPSESLTLVFIDFPLASPTIHCSRRWFTENEEWPLPENDNYNVLSQRHHYPAHGKRQAAVATGLLTRSCLGFRKRYAWMACVKNIDCLIFPSNGN